MDQQYRRNPEWRGVIDARLCHGSAGVGVALESYLSSCDEDWDECIMLT